MFPGSMFTLKVRLRVLLGGSCFFDFFDLLLPLPFFPEPFLPPPDVDFLLDEFSFDFFLGLEDEVDLEEAFLLPVLATAFFPPLEDVLLFLLTAEPSEVFFPEGFLVDEEGEDAFFDFFGELALGDLAFFEDEDEDDFFVPFDPELLLAALTLLEADEEALRPPGRIFFATPAADLASLAIPPIFKPRASRAARSSSEMDLKSMELMMSSQSRASKIPASVSSRKRASNSKSRASNSGASSSTSREIRDVSSVTSTGRENALHP